MKAIALIFLFGLCPSVAMQAAEPVHQFKLEGGASLSGIPDRLEKSEVVVIDSRQKAHRLPLAKLSPEDATYMKHFAAAKALRLETMTTKRRLDSDITDKGSSKEEARTGRSGGKFYDKDTASRRREQKWTFDVTIQNKTNQPAGPFKLQYVQFAEQARSTKDSGGSSKNVDVKKESGEASVPVLSPFAKFSFQAKEQILTFQKAREKRSAPDGFDHTQTEDRGTLDSIWIKLTDPRGIVVYEYTGPGTQAEKAKAKEASKPSE